MKKIAKLSFSFYEPKWVNVSCLYWSLDNTKCYGHVPCSYNLPLRKFKSWLIIHIVKGNKLVNTTWPLNYSKGINSVTHIFGPRKTLIFFDRKIRTHTYFCLLLKLPLFPWRCTYHSRTEKENFDVGSKWLDSFDWVYACGRWRPNCVKSGKLYIMFKSWVMRENKIVLDLTKLQVRWHLTTILCFVVNVAKSSQVYRV